MKIGLVPVSLALVLAASALACANAANNNPAGLIPGADAGADGAAKANDNEESADDPPHALGMIALSETHAAGASSSTPGVSAAFLPTTKSTDACGREVDNCTILAKANCGGSDAGSYDTGCGTNEVCTLDESCQSVCQPLPHCTTTCSSDEECKIVNNKSKCVPKLDFNAGVLTISGDGVSKTLTLRPPYTKSSADGDSPFVPGGTINVNASGASDVGFDKFSDSFKATTFIEPKPALTKQLDPATVFDSSDSVTLSWKPGEDKVQIMLTGNKGTALCKADDASGSFEITRKVLKQIVQNDSSTYSSPSLSVSITRAREELKKDKKTVGSIDGEDLPPVGFVRFVTQSTETYTAQGCPSGQKLCPSYSGGTPTCTNVLTDSNNCGDCGVTCTYPKYCSSGACY